METLVAEKGLVAPDELARRTAEWDRVVRETPPGQPLVLPRLAPPTSPPTSTTRPVDNPRNRA